MRTEYLPKARQSVGASELPEGRAYYEWRVRHFTTVRITSEEVHALGLAEVARIRADMDAVLKQLQWSKSFPEFLQFLRTDPRFYAKTPYDLLKEASTIAKRMDSKLRTKGGRERYRRRSAAVEPVFGQMKDRQGARRFSMSGLECCRGEWHLHAAVHNLRKLHRDSVQSAAKAKKRESKGAKRAA